MTKGERIKQRRIELRLSVDEIATRLNKNRATVYRYESNDIEDMPTSILEPLAKALETTPAYLMGWEDEEEPTKSIYSIPNIIPLPETELVPLIGTIACGTPITAVENIAEYLKVEKQYHADFALTCQGDSMINARIFDGDIVFIREQPMVDNGEIAAVLIDDEATLKRVYRYENSIQLRAENPMYPPLEYEKEEMNRVRILGKAVAFSSIVR